MVDEVNYIYLPVLNVSIYSVPADIFHLFQPLNMNSQQLSLIPLNLQKLKDVDFDAAVKTLVRNVKSVNVLRDSLHAQTKSDIVSLNMHSRHLRSNLV